MSMANVSNIEAETYRALNRIVEPAVRAGCGAPGIVPVGLIVLETKGWRSGRWHRTPVLAGAIGDYLLVSTVRGRRSNWVKNMSHNADVNYWSWGELRRTRAIVFAPDEETPGLQGLPPRFASLGVTLTYLASDFGCAFALLAPPAGTTA